MFKTYGKVWRDFLDSLIEGRSKSYYWFYCLEQNLCHQCSPSRALQLDRASLIFHTPGIQVRLFHTEQKHSVPLQWYHLMVQFSIKAARDIVRELSVTTEICAQFPLFTYSDPSCPGSWTINKNKLATGSSDSADFPNDPSSCIPWCLSWSLINIRDSIQHTIKHNSFH